MHLLATELATLDEADVAVDLGQPSAELVVLSFSDTDLSAVAEAGRRGADGRPSPRLGRLTAVHRPAVRPARLERLCHPRSVPLYVGKVIAGARLVIVRCLGGFGYWRYGLERVADLARDNGILFAALPGDDRADPRLASL